MRYLFLITLVLLFNSCHVARFFVYNFANITDYKKFHNSEIAQSDTPFKFQVSDRELSLHLPKYSIYNDVDLDRFNELHKSVAFVIIKNDSIVYQWYADKYERNTTFTSFSMAKSYVSALVGIAIEEGFISSVEDPITDYLSEFKNSGFENITIENVLNMRTGIAYKENYYSPFGNVAIGYYGRSLDRHLKKLKIKREPGKQFDYVSIATQILGEIIEKSTGKSLSLYCEDKIWKKIGTEFGATWSLDRKDGMEKAFCCLNAKAVDYAKMGRLYLHGGAWEGAQVVPKEWVKASVEKSSSSKDNFYAYQWWHFPDYSSENNNGIVDFYMQGHLGQYVYVNPNNNAVIVRLGTNRGGVYWDGMLNELAATIK